MSTFAPQPQVPFTMGQWGMPQIPTMQLPGADLDPMSQLNPMAGMGQPSPGFLPQGASYGQMGPALPGAGGGGFMDSLLGTKEAPGWGGTAMGAASGIFNAWMGMKQYGLAKDTLETNKQQFAQNFGAQQKMTNSRLEDRQRARVASNAGAYQSVGDYMKTNGV